jgi:hypothetical protein
MNDYIIIIHDNNIYNIEKDNYETDENTYKRGWFIIKNQLKYKNFKELISRSFIYLNEDKKNMNYRIADNMV